ncbi:MAG: YtxH domain-containing protein [Muribaculaceae bacterium]|nr:YtxH domain-containing protein [Muribaculaceae bacterium]
MANNSVLSGTLGAFIGGALMGFTAAVLCAPQRGEILRKRIKEKLSQHSMILSDAEVDELIARLEEDDEEIV